MERIADILGNTSFFILEAGQTLQDLLSLWQKFSVNPVGVLDGTGKLAGVLGQDMLLYSGEGLSLSTPVEELMSADFCRVAPDTSLEEAWASPAKVLAVFGAEEELLGLLAKADLAVHLYRHTKLINQELDAVLNSAQTGIIAINKEGIITTFNPAAEKITWRNRGEAVGKPLAEVIIPTGLIEVLETGEKQFEQRLPVTYSQGTRVYITNRSPIIEDGQVVGAVGIFQDISEFEFISQELTTVKELNKELTALIESSYDGILITDCMGVIQQVNEAYIRMTGLDKPSITGHPFQELVSKGHCNSSIVPAVLKKKKSVTQIQVSPLSHRLLITANPVLNEKKDIIKVVINVRDLTEMDKLRQELQDSKSLNRRYQAELNTLHGQKDRESQIITSKSPEMQGVFDLCVRVAQVDSTVLLLGESGVGKEVLARLIHNSSGRRSGPFIKVNCGAIPEPLLESELFGYERGAFTGAGKEGKAGLFEMADNGTILLDEVGDLPLPLQVKLLRVLQDREFTRIGGITTKKVNVHILAATNRDLEQMVKQGNFREDLYFRLNVVPVYIPPLRSRKPDILPLLEHFMEKFYRKYDIEKRLDPEVTRILLDYDWPGNIRELENMVERLLVTSPGPVIMPDCLPASLVNKVRLPDTTVNIQGIIPLKDAVLELEQQLISRAIQQYGSTYKAAEALGVNQSTIVRKLVRFREKHGARNI